MSLIGSSYKEDSKQSPKISIKSKDYIIVAELIQINPRQKWFN